MGAGRIVAASAALVAALVPSAARPSQAAWPECRRSREVAPREGAAYATRADQAPRPGNYLTLHQASLEPGESIGWGFTRISKPMRTPSSFTYDVGLPNGIRLGLEVRHADPTSLTDAGTGIYLRELAWKRPERGDDEPFAYTPWARAVPAAPMKLMGFPVQSGSRVTDVALDVGPDHEVLPGIARPAAGLIRSEMVVGFAETIEVCHRLAQGWNVHWDVEVEGELPFRMFGQLWIATQWGGWPIRSDLVLDRGNGYREEFLRLMRLRPGWR